jgi:AmiR/NasT family two-component response regulator
MNTLKDRIRSTKAQFRIAVKQYNQAQRLMGRLKKSLEQLEKKDELARAKQKAKHADRE